MATYLVTVAEEVYRTFKIHYEPEGEEPDVDKWNTAALELRDHAWEQPLDTAVGTDSEWIDFLTIEKVEED